KRVDRIANPIGPFNLRHVLASRWKKGPLTVLERIAVRRLILGRRLLILRQRSGRSSVARGAEQQNREQANGKPPYREHEINSPGRTFGACAASQRRRVGTAKRDPDFSSLASPGQTRPPFRPG